ncbi:DEAD/DEAH box helicase family protein [Shewanella sp. 5_MG-2023]|uniref:DEAD/DEAH box helicase n=1 Tax=unclassified Shewanella TaxID=196818 RepID=UPI000C833FD0|nr:MULTISPECIES: DEAD/DEAH box helicase family protein [unclassified Shewanella]MDO6642075.1 DEAD/DEAH box helicase family protein [Shewanella sp. 5_MG-2023]PMH99871.1 DEAD/DEAH box helicase [Shewanella sp. 10N.286.48.A6]
MKLRKWQATCIELALKKYGQGAPHFLTLATPGAGKTIMASTLAKRMLERDLVDVILCFSPSATVCLDFCETLEIVIGERFDGLLGARGRSMTYQSMKFLDYNFWQLFDSFRVFVIFDEIHHCAGSCIENANAWGEQVIFNIQNRAKHTLALTGTPWRSDTAPIVLSQYCSHNHKIHCDYVYGLAEAIRDGVCRVPQIIAIDNDNISVTEQYEGKSFSSFKELLSQSFFPYLDVVHNEKVIRHIVDQANCRLEALRKVNPDAGGLIIASSVEHANQILEIMHCYFGETAMVITYREDAPTSLIHQFRNCTSKWVISVGMISEGTNIPRLQVCCHLTNIKTEMHYRQILGRILRRTDITNQKAYLYMPAEPKLVEYAYRVALDIPDEADVIKLEKMTAEISNTTPRKAVLTSMSTVSLKLDDEAFYLSQAETQGSSISTLTETYEKMINIVGRFKSETIDLGLI